MAIFKSICILGIFACLMATAMGRGQIRKVRWCAGGYPAYYSCQNLVEQMHRNGEQTLNVTMGITDGKDTYHSQLVCIFAAHDFECADLIRLGKADVARLMAEELYGLSTSSVYNDLVIAGAGMTDLHECIPGTDCHNYVREYSVAIVRKTSNIKSQYDLRDKKACFSNVSASAGRLNTAGWIIPVSHLISNWQKQKNPNHRSSRSASRPHQNRTDFHSPTPLACPIDLNVVQDAFPSSCAPGHWASDEIFGPMFNRKLCELCMDRTGEGCSPMPANDPIECLKSENRGHVAFVSSKEIERRLKMSPPTLQIHTFGTVCDGIHGLDRYRECHWGIVPEDAYVVAGNRRDPSGLEGEREVRFLGAFARRLLQLAKLDHYDEYGRQFLADQSVIEIRNLGNKISPKPLDYLRSEGGKSFLNAMSSSTAFTIECPDKNRMRLCVLSDAELQKCHEMQLAFGAAALPAPSLKCVVGYSRTKCLDMLKNGQADITVMDAHRADDYVRAGRAKPLMKEAYHQYGAKKPYAVAVTFGKPKINGLKNLFSLDKGKQLAGVCSSGTDSFAGWEAPNSFFKKSRILPMSECKLTEAWAERLRPSCVPGALNVDVTLGRSSEYPIDKNKANRLCEGCGSTSLGTCKTPAEAQDPQHALFDTYYGDIGALKCIRRTFGDVAFIKSTALETLKLLKEANEPNFKNVDLNDIYILCSDGDTYRQYSEKNVETCNLGRVPDLWMVARPDADDQQLLRWQDIWIMAQERGRAHFDWLRTYIAFNDTDRDGHFLDLIFSNATAKLDRFDIRNPKRNWTTLTYDDQGFVDPFPTQCKGKIPDAPGGGQSSVIVHDQWYFRVISLGIALVFSLILSQ